MEIDKNAYFKDDIIGRMFPEYSSGWVYLNLGGILIHKSLIGYEIDGAGISILYDDMEIRRWERAERKIILYFSNEIVPLGNQSYNKLLQIFGDFWTLDE